MPENTDMSAPITLAEGYNPFSDENAPQVQQQVEVAPTATNEPNNEEQLAQVSQENQNSAPSSFDPNSYFKERFGFDTVDEAEQAFTRLMEENE